LISLKGIEASHKKGKLASLIGIEGGHAIGTSLAVLRMFYQLGARYLTLTHTCNIPWADCCKVDEPGRVPHIGGLSHFGTVHTMKSVNFHAHFHYFFFIVARRF
jgi:membrane dipeptidase